MVVEYVASRVCYSSDYVSWWSINLSTSTHLEPYLLKDPWYSICTGVYRNQWTKDCSSGKYPKMEKKCINTCADLEGVEGLEPPTPTPHPLPPPPTPEKLKCIKLHWNSQK